MKRSFLKQRFENTGLAHSHAREPLVRGAGAETAADGDTSPSASTRFWIGIGVGTLGMAAAGYSLATKSKESSLLYGGLAFAGVGLLGAYKYKGDA